MPGAVPRRILADDTAAFQDLFDRFFPRLCRFALARPDGDCDLAGEVVQAHGSNELAVPDGETQFLSPQRSPPVS